MKHNLFSIKGNSFKSLFVFFITAFVIASCSCPECPPATTTTTETTAPPTGTANFHHLRMDSATVVNSFMLLSPSDFKKMVLGIKVNDFSNFAGSLTLAAYPAKNNNDLPTTAPTILSIESDVESLSTDIMFSTLEIRRDKIANLVGNNGQLRQYKYLVFIPYVADSSGRKYLSYRVEGRPKLPDAAEPSENTNPCPPFKPE